MTVGGHFGSHIENMKMPMNNSTTIFAKIDKTPIYTKYQTKGFFSDIILLMFHQK